MAILITNDDGIESEGLWALVKALNNITPVVVVAPDKEQSAIGTAVTLHQRLGIRRVKTVIPEVEAYSLDGTPSDCVIVGLSMLVGRGISIVVSGINQGANLGDDVLISGTVAGALQGYLRGVHAIAVSVEGEESYFMDTAASLAALLCQWLDSNSSSGKVFVNVNVPKIPPDQITGVKVTRLASGSHTDIAQEENQGSEKYYRLVRQRTDGVADDRTDVWAVEHGNISITSLNTHFFNELTPAITDNLGNDLFTSLGERGSL